MKANSPFVYDSLIIFGYLNFILLTPLISIVFGIIGLEIPANIVTFILNFNLILIANLFYSRNRNLFVFLIVILLITLFVYISSFMTGFLPSKEKFYLIVYNIIIPIFILLLMGNTKLSPKFTTLLKKNFYSFYIKCLGFLFISLFFVFKFPSSDGRPILSGMENPIWLARIFGTLLILSFINKFGFKYGFIDFIFKALLILIILTISSRGVILSVIIVLFVLFWNYFDNSKIKKKTFLILTIVVISISLNYLDVYIEDPKSLYSIFRRLELFEEFRSIEFISVFGNGLGSFGPLVLGVDERDYPHNYFLEYLFEFGIVGIFCAFAFIFVLLKNFNKSFVGYIGFYFLLGSLSSGDIPGNSFYYLSLFVLFYLSKIIKNYNYGV